MKGLMTIPNVGDVCGIYEILERTDRKAKDGHVIFRVRCTKCGREFYFPSNSFAPSATVTRCYHGLNNKPDFKRIRNKRLRSIFKGMYNRCYMVTNKDYGLYGGAGVTICDEWMEDPRRFEKWARRNGYDDTLTIDRCETWDNKIHGYAPENCRWITGKNNAKYKSTTNIYTIDGITDSGRGWSTSLGLGMNRVNRLARHHGKDFATRFIRDSKDGFLVLIPKNGAKHQ